MFQFRIRTLFAFTLASALLFACLFAFPAWLGCLLLALGSMGALPLVASGVFFGRGAVRAMAVGAATLAWVTLLLNLVTVYLLASGLLVSDASGLAEIADFCRENQLAVKGLHLFHFALLGMAGGLSYFVWRRNQISGSPAAEAPQTEETASQSLAANLWPARTRAARHGNRPGRNRLTKRQLVGWLAIGALVAAIFAGTYGLMEIEPAYGIVLLWPATLMIYPVLTVMVWAGRGLSRAFALGALSSAVITLLINMGLVLVAVSASFDSEPELMFLGMLAVKWALVLGGGIAGAVTYALSATLEAQERPAMAPETNAEREAVVVSEEQPQPVAAWRVHRADGPHELAGPRFGGDQPVTPAGDTPDSGDDDRPIRRPR